jgi:hypothetical protein
MKQEPGRETTAIIAGTALLYYQSAFIASISSSGLRILSGDSAAALRRQQAAAGDS